MPEFETTSLVVGHGRRCEDRVAVHALDDGVVVVVADGAGGIGSGDLAAETVLREVSASVSSEHAPGDWVNVLQRVDQRIGAGEATGVVACLTEGIVGASVGDSQAWFVADGELHDLTRNQVRKPLLGSGEATATGFAHPTSQGLLLVATDGFCNYVRRRELLQEILWIDFPVLARRLVEMVRLPSGDLWDDIGLVVCRPKRAPQQRRRLTID